MALAEVPSVAGGAVADLRQTVPSGATPVQVPIEQTSQVAAQSASDTHAPAATIGGVSTSDESRAPQASKQHNETIPMKQRMISFSLVWNKYSRN